MNFLDAPGSIGKTFLMNILLAKLRTFRKIGPGVTSKGISIKVNENPYTG